MRHTFRIALAAALGLLAASSARAAYSSGDILAGFTKPGAANDIVFDLGKTLFNGQTWDLSLDLAGQFANLNSVKFGAVGAVTASSTIYSTTDGSFAPIESSGLFATIRANVATIGQNSIFGGSPATPAQSQTFSWLSQTAQAPGTPGNTFQNNLDNPNAVTPANFTSGAALASLYSNDNLGGNAVLEGTFSLSSGGVLTFSAVPEPSTLALCICGLGFLALCLRRQYSTKF